MAAAPFMHPVCGPALAFGRSSLHRAVCDMNVMAIQNCGATELMERDEAGYCPLHTAAALSMLTPSNTNLAFDICKLLVAAGADATFVDSNGNTPLHWAARAGNEPVAHLMLLNNCQTGTYSLRMSYCCICFADDETTSSCRQTFKIMLERHHCIGQCALGSAECQL